MLEKIIKNEDFHSFKKIANFSADFFKSILPYMVTENFYKIEMSGNIVKKDYVPIFQYLKSYFLDRSMNSLNDIFNYIINSKRKMKFKKISRYSSTLLVDVERIFFKSLFKNDFNFSCRYGKELFLRDKDSFKEISLRCSLINYGYKSLYISSLIDMLEHFPNLIDELMQIYLNAYCLEYNNIYFYDKAFDISQEYNQKSFRENLNNREYNQLKYNIINDKKTTEEFLKSLLNRNISFKSRINLLNFFKLKDFSYSIALALILSHEEESLI